MLRQEKQELVDKLRSDMMRAEGVMFLDYTKLKVIEADRLRRKMQLERIDYRVVKNTLARLAMKDTPFAKASEWLKGTPTGVVIGYEDPVASARVTFEFLKDCDHLKVKGGIVDKKAITPKECEQLSKMPSKGELQAGIVTLALSPGRLLAGQIRSVGARIAGQIKAIAERLEGPGA